MTEVNISYSPFQYQTEFHNSERRFIAIVGGRRVGKSKSALHELIKHCLLTPNALAWWVAQTYRDAQEIGWEMFMEHREELDIAIKKINQSKLTITFINGAQLIFKGSDNPDSLRGRGLTMVVMDEAAFQDESVWTKSLRPALSDKKGKAIFTSTPNGRNWYYLLWKRANAPSTQQLWSWWAYHWPTEINPIIGEEEINDARDNMSSVDFRQEYLAEFVTKAGLIYDDFNDDNVIDTFFPDRDNYTFYMGMDFGYANPTAICFMAVDNLTGSVTQFDELYINRTPIEQIEKKLHQKLGEHSLSIADIRFIYTDPAGNADELSSGISPVDYLRSKGWKVQNMGSLVSPGLAMVRSFILNANGKRRFHIHSRCSKSISSIYGYSYKLGLYKRVTEEPDKDNVHDHMCDAIRYFFVNRFDQAKYVTDTIEQTPFSGVVRREPSVIMKRCGKCRKKFPSRTPKDRPPFICLECDNAN